MATKEEILKAVRNSIVIEPLPLPIIEDIGVTFENKFETFSKMLASVGGEAIETTTQELDSLVKKLYPDAKVVASMYDGVESNLDLNSIDDPHKLKDIDVAVVKGEFGVAENGAIWVKNIDNRHRSVYFIAQNLIIVVPKSKILNNMHEAYELISFEESGYGVFISGPSKTADIEQSLVIGAHGPKSSYVLFV